MKVGESMDKPMVKNNSYFSRLLQSVWKSRNIYLLLLPGIIWYIVFAYYPMSGLSLAFKTYKANLGIFRSPWVGFLNYEYVFRDVRFFESIKTTLIINLGRMLIAFPFPIILALALNEVRVGRYKKIMQTVFTFPNFLSWVLVAGILINFLGMDGFVNNIIKAVGGEPISFLGDAAKFRPMVFVSEVWKASGWSAIIYLAAISGIDTEQYQAAEVDGATRLQRMFYVTVPSITSTIVVMLILACGNLMSAGFDQVFNMSNAAVKGVSETLDMYIYNITFMGAADFSFSSAVSLLKSIINLILLLVANKLLMVTSGSGLFGIKEEE